MNSAVALQHLVRSLCRSVSQSNRRLRTGPQPNLVAPLLCALLVLVASTSAQAQDDLWSELDWRRGTKTAESQQEWAFELRFGSYRPRVDDEFSNGQRPFEQVFGSGGHLYFGIEIDWQALRIPHFGSFGPGLGWGYTSMSALAKLEGTNIDSAEKTSLWIMPFYGVGVLRVDVLARECNVPFVPYGKLGAGVAFWRASNELGTSTYEGVSGKGHSWGLQAAGGLALQLDFLDASATRQLDNSAGINHSYFFFEWDYSNLGAVTGGQMHVGSSSWVLGLALEI